jgi:uncharacterized protein (TIGR03067 family)
MYTFLFALLASSISPADFPPPEEATIEDRTPFQGRWKVVAIRSDGRDLSEGGLNGGEWLFRADRVVYDPNNGLNSEGTFNVDSLRNPPEIAIRFGGSSCTRRVIWRVRGEWMDLAYVRGGPPPAKFESEKGSRVILETLQRIKK